MLLSGRSRIVVGRKHLRLDVPVLVKLLRISVGGMFQFLVATASWLGLTRIIAVFGSEALAGYTLALRILIFAMLPSWGMSNAAATMMGQSLGAGKPDRAERAVWLAGFYNMCFLGAIGFLFVAFPHQIVSWFTADPVVFGYAVSGLRTIACGFLFYAYGMVLTQSFNGAGDTRTPTVINLFVFWLWEIPLAYVLAIPLGFGPRGVFLAITIAFSTLAFVSAIFFRRGKWKRSVV
jgi:Na+-driven multidrug efflux pump